MNGLTTNAIETWESEGGALPGSAGAMAPTLDGSVAQVEWAQRIRANVNADFDRVAASFRVVANNQNGTQQADTESIISILEDKRDEVMRRQQAGYFIHEWQEIGDQIRQLIFRDARYQEIKSNRPTRRQ